MTRLTQEAPWLSIKKKDVYNKILKARSSALQGKTPVEAVMK
jgi:hypothetical protein